MNGDGNGRYQSLGCKGTQKHPSEDTATQIDKRGKFKKPIVHCDGYS